MSVLDAIGNTSVVPLRRVVPDGCARVFVKLEWENPTGSMKDRMALSLIEQAEADGRLKPGDTVVEYTGGSTGTSLALVCAAKGYPLKIVTSNAASQEKRDHMAALGAQLTIVHAEGGRTTKKLILEMVETARALAQAPNTYWTNQLHNRDAFVGYEGLAEEIWSQTTGAIDAFVQSVGTSGCIRGVAARLRQHNPDIVVAAVEPGESAVLRGGAPGSHNIEGVGIGYEPPLWDGSLVNEVIAVSTDDAKAMARRLARDEGLFAGTSSGANVLAAIQLGQRLGPQDTIVTLMCDSGLKYMSTDVFTGGR